MSVFNRAFAKAATTMSAVFSEDGPASYIPPTGDPVSLMVIIDRDVKQMDVSGGFVSPSVEISWRKTDLATVQRNAIIQLSSGERWRLNQLVGDDGIFVSYQVIPA
jgi:hypothetical protein